MKKYIFIALMLAFVTGCGREKNFTCISSIKNDSLNYELEAKYKIFYKGSYVTKINKTEKYISKEKDILKYFENSKVLEYDNSNDIYGGFNYEVKKGNDYIEIKTIIDMKIADIDKMAKNGYIDKDFVVSDKFTINGAHYFYESIGAVCNR